MSIDLLLKFSLFHITANIKQDNRMLSALLKAKCRIMPTYYLEQPCKLSFNESYTGSNIHILNLTCSPDTTEKYHFILISQRTVVYVITLSFWLYFSAFHKKTFDPFGLLTKAFSIRWLWKSEGELLNVPYDCSRWENFVGSLLT